MPHQSDLRRQPRETADSRVSVVWHDEQGNDKVANAVALDVSEIGLRLQMPEPIRVQSYVTLRSEKLGIHGRGSVRYCTGRAGKYILGVEFSAGLRRRPKA